MAFCGHVSPSGHIVLRDEVYTGRTRINLGRSSSGEFESPVSESSEQASNAIDNKAVIEGGGSSRTYILTDNQSVTQNASGDDSSSYTPPPVNGNHSMSAESLCSWSEMYGGLKQSGSQSMVPSLALGSKASSMSYRAQIQSMKVGREPDAAFDNWYSAKEQQRQKKQLLIKAVRDQEQNKIEERKRLAQSCYDEWLRNKARQASDQRSDRHLQIARFKAACAIKSDNGKSNRDISPDKIREVVQGWWLKKQEQRQRQREAIKRAELLKALDEQSRRKEAEMAWEKWMSKVSSKPKPVPMNQGMDSLRGTISQLYINPQHWQGTIIRQGPHKY
ncbi:uncharacterized protein Dwil_GK15429 [Drosophila willistoni]|uniref:Coiled-coil domain-containing protein n=1 Tax=Drosophila willistoni TaxID=7260 RepID=B4MV43_DROWI|nr:uncharacterized protein LOC6641805 [Drosophila willistoni]EDW76388.1 uncharacterized protein Dwil_GK15429 [Drosophila willistoni]